VELKDIIRCPTCGSAEIIYSCEPKCCFNHVCADCRTSFQIVTHKTGRFDRERQIAPMEPASGDPTTGCAACDSLNLALISEGPPAVLICGNCRAVLELAIEEVEAA
jgi:transcription elongation factor Elf1